MKHLQLVNLLKTKTNASNYQKSVECKGESSQKVGLLPYHILFINNSRKAEAIQPVLTNSETFEAVKDYKILVPLKQYCFHFLLFLGFCLILPYMSK